MPLQSDLLLATEAFRALASKYGSSPINARKFHELILNAVIPAERVNGRYYVRRSDLPHIANAIGFDLEAGMINHAA